MAKPRRYELQQLLVELLGVNQVYFQPPATLRMKYPCIVYEISKYEDLAANNSLYSHKTRYQVTAIDRDPDSEIPEKLNQLPYTSLDSTFVSDGLNHFVFTLYF